MRGLHVTLSSRIMDVPVSTRSLTPVSTRSYTILLLKVKRGIELSTRTVRYEPHGVACVCSKSKRLNPDAVRTGGDGRHAFCRPRRSNVTWQSAFETTHLRQEPWCSRPTPSNAAACTSGESSSSGYAAGWRVGTCRNSILEMAASQEPRRAAAIPSSTPAVVASCSWLRYRNRSVAAKHVRWPAGGSRHQFSHLF